MAPANRWGAVVAGTSKPRKTAFQTPWVIYPGGLKLVDSSSKGPQLQVPMANKMVKIILVGLGPGQKGQGHMKCNLCTKKYFISDETSYPLTEPIVMPRTKLRWKARKSTIMGRAEIAAPAISRL